MATSQLFIPLILGTAREGRLSEAAAHFMFERLRKQKGVESMLVDVRDYHVRATDHSERLAVEKRFAKIMNEADGLVIVAPEYNHGYPGELKMLLDMAFDEYAGKPVGICGVSDGNLGGARMVEQLRLVAVALRLVPISQALYFSNITKLVGPDGTVSDPAFDRRSEKFFKELLWYAEALRAQRKKSNFLS